MPGKYLNASLVQENTFSFDFFPISQMGILENIVQSNTNKYIPSQVFCFQFEKKRYRHTCENRDKNLRSIYSS